MVHEKSNQLLSYLIYSCVAVLLISGTAGAVPSFLSPVAGTYSSVNLTFTDAVKCGEYVNVTTPLGFPSNYKFVVQIYDTELNPTCDPIGENNYSFPVNLWSIANDPYNLSIAFSTAFADEDSDDTMNAVEFPNDGVVTISYYDTGEYGNGVLTSVVMTNASFGHDHAEGGLSAIEVDFDAPVYYSTDSATVTIDASPLNDDADVAETANIQVISETDLVGVTVVLTETGGNTGIFSGTLTFSETAGGANVLLATEGDNLNATLDFSGEGGYGFYVYNNAVYGGTLACSPIVTTVLDLLSLMLALSILMFIVNSSILSTMTISTIMSILVVVVLGMSVMLPIIISQIATACG